MDMREILHRISERENLSAEEIYRALEEIVDGGENKPD